VVILKKRNDFMTKKDEIKKEIWQIWQILLLAKECHSYSFYLHKPDTKEEFEYLQHSNNFIFIRHIMWRMTVIELSKLFKESAKSDRYNIFHFISKLKTGGYFGKIGISESVISEWENQINYNSETISKILLLRDKLYSHTDSDKEKYSKNDVSFEKTEKLIKIVESIVQEIYSTVFDSHALIETISFDRKSFKMIKILAEERNKITRDLLEEFQNRK